MYTEFKPSFAAKWNDGGTFFFFYHILSQLAKLTSFFTICVTEFVNHNCLMWLQVQNFFLLSSKAPLNWPMAGLFFTASEPTGITSVMG